VLHSASHAAPRGLVSRFSLLLDFGNYCKVCRLQARIDSIPIADSPHPPQTPAASFKRLYRTRARASCSRLTLRRKRASDRALTFLRTYPVWVVRLFKTRARLPGYVTTWIASEQGTAFCAVCDDKKQTTYAYVSWRVRCHSGTIARASAIAICLVPRLSASWHRGDTADNTRCRLIGYALLVAGAPVNPLTVCEFRASP
jgi:hypothetical protein